jgi:hypothetical protein
MRRWWLLPAIALAAGCAHAAAPRSTYQVELQLDEGRAVDRPLIPGRAFEELLRFDPKLPSWTPLRLRLLLAQPGAVVLTLYAEAERGRPGAPLHTVERRYGAELVAAAGESKWVVEELLGVPPQKGAVFVGLYSPERDSDPRLWATPNASGAVFQRGPDGALSPVPRTPVLRLDVAPSL